MKHGEQLTIKLQELGIKKKRLAELLGVHPNTITQWLNKQQIDVRTRVKIAQALKLTKEEIFSVGQRPDSESGLHMVNEPLAIYGGSVDDLTLKKLDALQYCGLLSNSEDALTLQKEWRAEW